MSPQMGRPKSDNPKSARLEIRVTPEEKESILQFSKKYNIGLLELLRIGIDASRNKK